MYTDLKGLLLFAIAGWSVAAIMAGGLVYDRDVPMTEAQASKQTYQLTCFTAKGEVWLDKVVTKEGDDHYRDGFGTRFELTNATCLIEDLGNKGEKRQ